MMSLQEHKLGNSREAMDQPIQAHMQWVLYCTAASSLGWNSAWRVAPFYDVQCEDSIRLSGSEFYFRHITSRHYTLNDYPVQE